MLWLHFCDVVLYEYKKSFLHGTFFKLYTLFCVYFKLAKIYTRYRAEGEDYRTARNLKRIFDVPEYEKIPNKNLKPEKVRFLIDYKDPIKDDSVMARVTVQSIYVSELNSIHIVENNSPFVTLVCGSWRFTTEINALAGTKNSFFFACAISFIFCVVWCIFFSCRACVVLKATAIHNSATVNNSIFI